jgi:hypothetical protein
MTCTSGLPRCLPPSLRHPSQTRFRLSAMSCTLKAPKSALVVSLLGWRRSCCCLPCSAFTRPPRCPRTHCCSRVLEAAGLALFATWLSRAKRFRQSNRRFPRLNGLLARMRSRFVWFRSFGLLTVVYQRCSCSITARKGLVCAIFLRQKPFAHVSSHQADVMLIESLYTIPCLQNALVCRVFVPNRGFPRSHLLPRLRRTCPLPHCSCTAHWMHKSRRVLNFSLVSLCVWRGHGAGRFRFGCR